MIKKLKYRIAFDVALLLIALVFSWWVSFVLALVLLFLYKSFYEFILWGFLIDLLYGLNSVAPFGFYFFFSVLSIAIFLISINLRKVLKFYTFNETF